MKIEIWSDVLCPWCYIGKRRFETALAQFNHDEAVEITWRSFQLDPNAPLNFDGTTTERLMQKYGVSREQSEAMQNNVTMLAAQEGLEYHIEESKVTNSFDAHRLIHLAAEHDLQDDMKERLLKAHFVESRLISDTDTLVQLAVEVGLDADETRQMLESDDFADGVRNDQYQAAAYGIRGVPFFLFNEKYGVSGAQTPDVFAMAFERAWQDHVNAADVVGSGQES
jgi:predicted DsbA family dithiol-disulfide isomerase